MQSLLKTRVTHFVDEPFCPSPTNLQRSFFAKSFVYLQKRFAEPSWSMPKWLYQRGA